MNDQLQSRLAALQLPGMDISLGDTGARVRIAESDGRIAVEVTTGFPGGWLEPLLREQVQRVAMDSGLSLSSLVVNSRIASHAVQDKLSPLPSVRNIIAVGSGKGGVGKSTVAVNLALALAADGAKVGVLDADIYGPSVPLMLGLHGRPDSPDGKTIEPMRAHGVEAMSIGLLVDQDTPMIWRGPMATSALTQLLTETRWGGADGEGLDYLILDLPPGTGDIQLTMAQKIPVAGAVVVTTPQDVATLDARKALKMFEKVEVPVLGLVENMAVHVCTNCGHAEHVFGEGGGQRMAAQYGVVLLGSLPLEAAVREQGDAGTPIVAKGGESATAHPFVVTARRVAIELSRRPQVARPLAVSLLG
ncbi:iron-sulfur cluster carrier protein ApbC [Lysobacter niabensis]|uniref:iron-sulfur cluster carrier protein ApbC n=1 Tax=Agrilutibacter niabensis TaxID=380628 RepID=UPI0036087A40